MAETTIKDVVKLQGMTLAEVIWKKFRRQPTGYIERVLALNPKISLTMRIPFNTEIIFPVENLETQAKREDVVRLWD